MMITQNSADNIIDDGTLLVRCDAIGLYELYVKDRLKPYINSYSTKLEAIRKEDKLHIKGLEAEDIIFIYKPTEEEENCWITVSKRKEKITKNDDTNDGTIVHKWKPVNNPGYFNVSLRIKPRGKNKKSYMVPMYIYIREKVEGDYDTEETYYNTLNILREMDLEINRLYNPTKVLQNIDMVKSSNPLEELNIIDQRIGDIIKTVYQISRNPHKEFIDIIKLEKFSELDDIDPDIMHDIANQEYSFTKVPKESVSSVFQKLYIEKDGYVRIPTHVHIRRCVQTINVPINQKLKRCITSIDERIKSIEISIENKRYEKRLNKKYLEEIDQRIEICKELHKKLQSIKTLQFFNDVQEKNNIPESIFQKNMRYVRFYGIYNELMGRPIFQDNSDYLSIPIEDYDVLYQKLGTVLIFYLLGGLPGWKTIGIPNPLKIDKYSFNFELKTGNKSLIDLYYENNRNITMSLFYQRGRMARSTDRNKERMLRPDITIEIKISGKLVRVLVFDVKYRSILDTGDQDDPENPINKLHMYRDALVIRNPVTGDYDRITKDVYIIYIGDTHIDYLSKATKRDAIGGINLIPKKDNLEEIKKPFIEIIQKFITENIIRT